MLKLTCKIRATGVNILVVYIYAHVVALNFLLLWTKQILVISVPPTLCEYFRNSIQISWCF